MSQRDRHADVHEGQFGQDHHHKEIAGPCDAVPTNRKCCSVGIALKVATRFASGVEEGHQTEHNEDASLHLAGHWKMERKTIRHQIFGVAEAHVGCARHEEAKKNGANHEGSDECLLQARASVTN